LRNGDRALRRVNRPSIDQFVEVVWVQKFRSIS
jgi:hypothetical protein